MDDLTPSSRLSVAEAALGYLYNAYLADPDQVVHSDDVAVALHVDRSTAIRACHHLAEQQLVEGESGVRNNPDGAYFEGQITAQGVAIAKESMK